MRLLQNPIIKIVGISAIIYFALFANKNNPDSLGNRLSSDRIKKNINEMQEKSKFIVSNVKEAQNYTKAKEPSVSAPSSLEVKDIEIGNGKEQVICGSEVDIEIVMETDAGKRLEKIKDEHFVVGSGKKKLISEYIIGMKNAGVREISVPQNLVKSYKELVEFKPEIKSGVKYNITINNITQTVDNSKEDLSCN